MLKFGTLFLASILSITGVFAQNGGLDSAFNHDGITYHTQVNELNSHPRTVQRMLVMPDSTILLGCQSGINPIDPNGQSAFFFCRLDKNGTVLDTIPGQYPGFIDYRVIGFPMGIAADGNGVRDLTLLPNGKVLVTCGVAEGPYYAAITMCLNYPDLSFDSSYGINGLGQPWDGAFIQNPSKCALAPDGSSYIACSGYRNYNFDTSYSYIIKRKPNGMLDSSWQNNGGFTYAPQLGAALYDIRVGTDGSIYTCGWYKDTATVAHAIILKQHADGSVDTTYGSHGIATNQYMGWSMLLNNDGSTYMNGLRLTDNSYIAKYLPNGMPDNTFGINGRSDVPSHPPGDFTGYGSNDMVRQADGRLVMIGVAQGYDDSAWVAAWRVLTNGKMDSTFGINGIANYHIMPDTIPENFPSPILRTATCGAMQPDGKILMGGWFQMGNTSYGEMFAMRLNNIYTPTGIQTLATLGNMRMEVYPVPAVDMVNLRYQLANDDQMSASLLDLNGKVLTRKDMGWQNTGLHTEVLKLPKLPTGVYLLQMQGMAHKECLQLLVK